ncbi:MULTISPECIES: serine/threonine-protein kinase [Streptomyces]|uniref:serine/threonine-protein kinase n=1 Tax=Streptomyces TaxID=1883 RepID=UPI0004BD6855|nr:MULTISPECIES: serine/threonine-protein kinase [Streptomyces]MBP2345963.1 tRNA A-37 threonylcarbamoyl transferase component Bud32 [Streptomyces virginiae]MCI4083245.1 serine/threonine protein kinase [Streptomyces sp. MMS21 TC-5]QNE25749.1 serine/threonine protein kinase [Streptomyces sp. INR7]RST15876.1 serine/threonine protein kinase [Streptomyces sp. WAC05950]
MEQQTGGGAVLAGRYRLVEPIGRGGMGKVWRAHDELLHRTVAVKELTAGLYVAQADRDVMHARTQKEARAAARIQHPAVVTVHDVLEHDDRPWIVMEYIDGPSLADAAKAAGRIEPREAARIGLHVLGALRAAHAVGVLHRDVKPGNVLLAKDGRVLLTDFGIAAIEGDSSITRTGEIVGSIDYLAPERVTGGIPDPSSDLWSLGATLYTAVEARSPFRRTSPISSLQAVVNDEPPALRQAGVLGPVITALLRKDPTERPSAEEAERMLLEAMEGREPKAAHAYVPTRAVTSEELAPAQERPEEQASHEEVAQTAPLPEPAVSGTVAAPVPADRDGGWLKRAAVVALVAALLGGGGVFGILKYTADSGDGGQDRVTSSTGGQSGDEGKPQAPAPPAGYTKVVDPLAGFTLFVPEGWTRKANGDQIDYTPDDGKHFVRIAADPTPDYRDPLAHLLDLETQVSKRTDYKKVRLNQNTFRDSTRAALWDFTYTEKQNHPGPRRAKEQMYIAPDGTEYAIYISSPVSSWATTEQQFDVVLSGWEPPAKKS